MKKYTRCLALILIAAIASGMCACGKSTDETSSKKKKKKKVTSTTTVEETTVDPIDEQLETAVPAESQESPSRI